MYTPTYIHAYGLQWWLQTVFRSEVAELQDFWEKFLQRVARIWEEDSTTAKGWP